MKFNYQAKTKTGEIQSGIITAPSKEAALALLQRYGLFVTFLEEAEVVPVLARKIEVFEKVSRKDLVVFSRQLSILFKSKVPLVEALRTLSSQAKKSGFREKILEISDEVEAGTSFSKALARYPDLFSPFYISMVKSGELSGTLSGSLDYLADHLEREYDIISKIRGAMIYPALLVTMMIIVLILATYFVIPQLVDVLESLPGGQELPWFTKLIIDVTKFVRLWGWLVALGIIGIAALLFYYSKTSEGKKIIDQNVLKIPVIGPFFKMVYLSRFAENLSTLISGGLPIVQALETTSEVAGNNVYRVIILETSQEVKKGGSISEVLSRFPEAFPPIFIQMVLVGEKTGALDKTLKYLVSFYKKEIDRGIESLLALLEPILIIFLGLGVGIMVIGILMPLYQTISL